MLFDHSKILPYSVMQSSYQCICATFRNTTESGLGSEFPYELPLNLKSHFQMLVLLKLKRIFLFLMNVIAAESLSTYRCL